MPVYLLHGFRWPREGFTGIRVHAIVHNLEDCSVEYIQNENSKRDLLGSFRKLYPELMQHLENLKTGQTLEFIEQYDPEDEFGPNSASQPHAFVGDRVVTIASGPTARQREEAWQKDRISESKAKQKATSPTTATTESARSSSILHNTGRSDPGTSRSTPSSKVPSDTASSLNLLNALSVNVEEIMSSGPAVTPQAWEALAELRDKIAEGQKIGWWVVYNGDPDREFDEIESDSDYEGEEILGEDDYYEQDIEAEGTRTPTQDQATLPMASVSSPTQTQQERGRAEPQPRSSSLRSPTQKTHDLKHHEDRSHHKPTTSISSTASVPRPGTGGREPPPVTLPSIPHRTNPQPIQPPPSTTAGAGKPANLPEPMRKSDNIPEPPKAKEVAKKEGLRRKFFGKKT